MLPSNLLFTLHQKVTGPPKLPPDLERRIFEMCALESPEVCTVLVLVARRVHEWSVGTTIIKCFAHVNTRIDPILIATVCITERIYAKCWNFLAKLTNGKPVEYYAQHIKNLYILAPFPE
jgi:hypothetical protein